MIPVAQLGTGRWFGELALRLASEDKPN